MPTKLDIFLNGNPHSASESERKGRKVSKGEAFTHRSFDNMQGWFITSDDMDEFYRLYCDDLRHGNARYITEKQTPIGQARIDLDLKYDGQVDEHKHTRDQVLAFVGGYMEELKRFVQLPEAVEVFVLEKDYPTYDAKNKISSSGIHVQLPDIRVRADVEQKIRLALLKRMDEFFPNLGCNKEWRDVYDPQPLSHNNNWFLLGSKKSSDGALPYAVQYAIDWDHETGEMSIDTEVAQRPITVDLVKKFSLRSKNDEETPLTPEAESILRPLPPQQTEPGRAVSRGRQPNPAPPGSRSSSPGRAVRRELDPDYKAYIRNHAMNLGSQRYDGGHNDWFEVCQCLWNIHEDLKDVFDEFIDKSTHSERVRKADMAWYGCNLRVDGPRLGIRSLRRWSQMDNPDRFAEIESNYVGTLIEIAAMTSTENDVAMVIFAKYRDEFKCASYKNNEWYRFAENLWRPTENGIDLLARLSSDVAKMFHAKEQEQDRIIEADIDQCNHARDKPVDTCDTCKAEQAKKRYYSTRLRLKTTSFKENVMKECKLLFFDKEFAMKLDENKHLIGFKNGIYDTLARAFRPGTPEDCVSMCTNLEYNVTTEYHKCSCWPELRKFLESILPNRSVRDYYMKHLSRSLSGTYTQDFHILTGEGSNGKSMLMNLMMTCFGEYAYKVNIALFTQKRGKAGAAAPELVRMKGKRFVMMSEPDQDDTISEGFLKEVTGSEKIPCRDLYGGSKQILEMEIQAKFHMACNVKPRVTDTTNGTWRRLKVIDFPNKFVHQPRLSNELPIDESIMQKVQSEEWATCFMAYLIALYEEGLGHTKLAPPKEVEAYTSEYQEESDVIARFLREYVHQLDGTAGDPDALLPEPIPWTSIATTFQTWKRENEIGNRGSATDLQKRLNGQFGKMPRGGWTSFRFGPA